MGLQVTLPHGASHASGGHDPITPASIGAVSSLDLPVPYRIEVMEHWVTTSGQLGLGGGTFGAGGSFYAIGATGNHVGIVRLETANNATANTGVRMNSANYVTGFAVKGTGELRFVQRMARASVDWFSSTVVGELRFGLTDITNAQPTRGIYFELLNSADVYFVTRDNNVETRTPTGVSFVQSEWNTCEFLLSADGTTVTAKINGTTVATHTTYITNGGIGINTCLAKRVALAGYIQADLDFTYIKYTPTVASF